MANLIKQTLDLSLPSGFLVLERISLRTVEIRLSGSRYKDTRQSSGMAYRKDVLERCEAYGDERTMRDWVC